MKNLLVLIVLFLIVGKPFAQETTNDSYTIQRLLIFNEKDEVLLEKHENGWMTPALRHNTKVSTNEGLKNLASEFGLTISTPRLSGIFMFIPDYKPDSSFRQHYVCTAVAGELALPEKKLDVKWFAPHQAIELMSSPDAKLIGCVKEMTEQILNYPDIIWGGTFSLWKEEGVTKYKTTEHFYSIAERE